MAKENTSLMDKLTRKNIIDTIILGLVAILIVMTVLFIEDKSIIISISAILLIVFLVQSQLSRKNLVKIIDEILQSETENFQNASSKVVDLGKKQRELTLKHTDILKEVLQITKSFKNKTVKLMDWNED